MRTFLAAAVLGAAEAQDLFLAQASSSDAAANVSCVDVPPDDKGTCAQRLKWGGCDQGYMVGFCCQTCFGCDGSHSCPGSPTPAPVPTPPPPAPTPTPSTGAIRLRINGKQILDPSGSEIRLTGFNWVPDSHPAKEGEGAFTQENLPGANVARIVGIRWDDELNNNDCMTNDAPYWKESCFDQLDYTIRQAIDAKMWVILTARSKTGAGQDFQTDPMANVFHNSTLRDMMFTMWKHVVARYASWDYIAAYEILSEPRDKDASVDMVRDFYEGGCAAVHSIDSHTPCMVGPPSYYKLWTFKDDIILKSDKNVIYTFDYFVPDDWAFGRSKVPTYGGTYPCKDLYPGWSGECCPNGASADTVFDKDWNLYNFNHWAIPVRENNDVPIFINQWGLAHKVSAEAGHYQYMADVASALKDLGIGWTWWNWRGSGDTDFAGGSMAFVLKLPDGSEVLDTQAFDAVRPYMG